MITENDSISAYNSTNELNALKKHPSAYSEDCTERIVSLWQVFVDNLPYIAMILLGSAIFGVGFEREFWRWLWAGLYFSYGVAGALWIIVFVCPYCHFYDTRLCPCGYGLIAAKFRSKKEGAEFAQQFKKHIPAIVPLWFIPLIMGVIMLLGAFSWILLGLLLAFAINSYVILPLVSRRYGCASCPQKETCPWMACGKK
ncbi:MAG TPA: hypothetical protein VIH42_10310 [Thermoguttaceae bacterium]